MNAVIASFLAAATPGELNPQGLFDSLAASFRSATSATEVVTALQVVCFALITWGLVAALVKAGPNPSEVLSALAKALVIVGFVMLTSSPEQRDKIPDASEALANAVSGSNGDWKAPAKKVFNLAKLLFPAEDAASVDAQKVKGASQAWFFQVSKRIAEEVTSTLLFWFRVVIAFVVCVISFIALYIGWFIGECVVWLATILYEFGWVLVPVAVSALALESGKPIGQSYLLGMVAVGMSRFAIALAGLGTTALMTWVTRLFKTLTEVDVSSVLTSAPDDALRQKFAASFMLLPLGSWAIILIATIILAAWAIFTPLVAWKVFMTTLQRGSQFGSALGMAFAGATLAAAGNSLQMGGRVLAAGDGGEGGNQRALGGGEASQSGPPALPGAGMSGRDAGGGGGGPMSPSGSGSSLSAPAMSPEARQRALAAVGRAVMDANGRGASPELAHAAGVRAGQEAGAPADVADQMAGLANFVCNGTNTGSAGGGGGSSSGASGTNSAGAGSSTGGGGTSGGGGGGGSAGAESGSSGGGSGGRQNGRSRGVLSLPVVLGTAGAVLGRLGQHIASDQVLPPSTRGIVEDGYDLARATRAQSDQRESVRAEREGVDLQRQQLAELRRLANAQSLG